MTEDNRRRNLTHEIERAAAALRAAETLLAVGLFADSVTRSYFVAFHLIRALLLTRGLEPQSHRGTLHLFNREFIRPGLTPTTYNRLLGGLQRSRELADYDAVAVFAQEDAAVALDDARAFRTHALELLAREGWTAP